ncbi:MAG: glyoxylate/hydroxypyruvate reductase A [Boseongicola sp. SB0664_bin_43]|uniref:Glyoxylate/hydroxypyruvate reductase A n=1 Tax=Boseongicola sp. SB0664_bin_43 TaxID=2604844 RepID=A0A6B0XXZ4_9RHOB|nr:glyoxylate/hydroxypyruvate reductase A [Boseongicola sp. SB0664_bin_43]
MPRSPETIDYIVYAPSSDVRDFSPFTGVKAVLNLWAGVEDVVTNETLRVPLARMVDPGMTDGMVEWCVAHAMRHHLGIDRDICRRDAAWDPHVPPLARERPLTILGLGVLGRAAAGALSGLGFPVAGWSRTAKDVPGVTCLSGESGLVEALRRAELLILLLPLTPETAGLMNSERLALLPKGAILINPGRGPLIDDDALLAALDRGHVAHATLDVFREEPLPGDHPFWAHPDITVTPHIASATRPETAVGLIVENIRRGEAGEPLLHLVDRHRGY